MSYLVQIGENAQSKRLMQYLRTIKYVKVIETPQTEKISAEENFTDFFDSNGSPTNVENFFLLFPPQKIKRHCN